MSTLQERLVGYASRPEAETALFLAAMGETVMMPVSADGLLVPMVIINNDRAFRYALITAAGNVAGGIIAFLAGFVVYQALGVHLIQSYSLLSEYSFLREIFADYNFLIVLAAGLATVPYKIIALLSGFFVASMPPFVIAGVLARGARSTLMVWLLWRGGSRYKEWIERYFHGLSMVLALGALLFFVMVLLLVKTS